MGMINNFFLRKDLLIHLKETFFDNSEEINDRNIKDKGQLK
jgi:hypothetical protein